MNSGTCPKCSSTTILCSPEGTWPGMHMIRISTMDAALVECLICADCGYVEAYVTNARDRAKMLRAFERFNAGGDGGEERGGGRR